MVTVTTTPEELDLLRSTQRRFITEEVIRSQQEHGLDPDQAPPKDLRRRVRMRSKELGLYGLDMPADIGGGGVSFSNRCQLEMDLHSHDTVFFDDILGGQRLERSGRRSVLACYAPDVAYRDPNTRGEMCGREELGRALWNWSGSFDAFGTQLHFGPIVFEERPKIVPNF